MTRATEPTLDHPQAAELFSDYWDEELEPDQKHALEEHLRSCADCRRDYQAFQQALGAVQALGRAEASPGFTEGVVDRIRRRSRGRFFAPGRPSDRVPLEVFSLLMLGIVVAIYFALQLVQPAHIDLP